MKCKPLLDSKAKSPERHEHQPLPESSNFVPAMGNFSIQYNFSSASIAVEFLNSDKYLGYPLRAEPEWSKSITLPVVFLGATVGMLFMGRLGDVFGRTRAMQWTLALTIFGALFPALAMGGTDAVYILVCVGRFFLGVGVGGIYPLSAVCSAEGSHDPRKRGSRVASAFFWQTIGQVMPYVVAIMLMGLLNPQIPAPWVPDLQFRLLFAFGALPASIVFFASLSGTESDEFQAIVDPLQKTTGMLATFQKQSKKVRCTLVGTAGSWFLFDIVAYGTSTFTPQILQEICLIGAKLEHGDECQQDLFQVAEQSIVVLFMGIPGCLLALALIGGIGSKMLNILGFFLLSTAFASLACVWNAEDLQRSVLFCMFCVLSFLLNFGPNLGTYVLPAICFPAEIRSTFHGISATGGKLGALLGTLIFTNVRSSSAGVAGVLCMQAIICLLGMLVSQVFLQHDWQYLDENTRIATESFLQGSESTWRAYDNDGAINIRSCRNAEFVSIYP